MDYLARQILEESALEANDFLLKSYSGSLH